ncbi:activator of 90 kDa heat shock protein ATPase homolog 2-like isoform X2 [Stegodyphus dumicola]|uniref:activator of 90 kDa heat shock protein ATPase homolog 2-like isoform X2 n=1 Tax=Stegodyphus dumicola TaxID=202533 RepID=UPI0015AADDB3|nr:activator of 90 kDa heat shock protein ATPase homolog 2-like isoform X2 [Stegodyphus dumicola]
MKDVDVNVHLDTTGPESEILKDMLRTTGAEVIRQKLSEYVTCLREEFAKGLILPTKDSTVNEVTKTDKVSTKKLSHSPAANTPVKTAFETSELKTVESFKCTADEFYRAMTVKEMVDAFTRGSSVLEPKEGGKFELFDGNVQGNFVKLVGIEKCTFKILDPYK